MSDNMNVLEIIGGILMVIISIVLILLVLMQESPKGGITSLTGGDSYYNKNQGRTMDAMLFRATKYGAIVFFIITVLSYAAQRIR